MSRTNNTSSGFFGGSVNSLPTGITTNDQGISKNEPNFDLSRVPIFDLAYLSNVADIKRLDVCDSSADVIINLNPICLKWCDFTTLFFRAPSGGFWMNPSNSSSVALTMLTQTYETTQNKHVKFSLQDQIRKAWSKKNAKSETSIPPDVNILLNRVGFLNKSLSSVSEYCLGLSIDEVISALLNNNEIEPGNSCTSATVKFIISYKNYFEPLNTFVLINFAYITKIPCYKNTIDCFIKCTPYSNDCNACEELLYDVSSKKSHVECHAEDEDDMLSHHSSNSASISINDSKSSNCSDVIDKLSQFLKSVETDDSKSSTSSNAISSTGSHAISSTSSNAISQFLKSVETCDDFSTDTSHTSQWDNSVSLSNR